MKSETKYCVIDKSKLINLCSEFTFKDDALHEILNHIDNSLNILVNNNIKIQQNTLNFNNFECVECSMNSIINIYKFNIGDLHFYDISNNTYTLDNKRYIYTLTNIKNKLLQLNGTKTNQQQIITKHIKPVSENPIKHLFNDVSNTIKKNNNDNVINMQRKIPTMNTKIDNNLDDEIDHDENELESTNIDISKIVQPNISRPMNSIITEKEKELSEINIIDSSDICSDMDIIELEKTYKELQKLKEEEKQKLLKLKEITDDDVENFSTYCNDLGDKKRELRREKERQQERRNKYDANKYAYKKMKIDIMNGKLSEDKISDLFIKEYPVYKFMDQKELLDKEDEYIIYLKLYNEMYPEENKDTSKEGYVPHNINYLSEEEQDKYKEINNNKDMLNEFMNKNTKSEDKEGKKYPSLEQVLKSIDDENNDDLEIDTTKLSFDEISDEKSNEINKKMDIIEKALKSTVVDDSDI